MLLGTFVTLVLSAQPNPRPLPNQFRDFVDHQQRWNSERPVIERKDGKVIITMSEEQFNRMRQLRMAQRFRPAHHHKPQAVCSKCKKLQGKSHRGKS